MNRLITSKHQHILGEGIIWDHYSGLLLFVDILSKKLFSMDIDSFKIVDEYYFNFLNHDNILISALKLDGKFIFQTKVTKLTQYVTDLKYGELFEHTLLFENNSLKDINISQNNEDVLRFIKPE